MKPSLFLFVSIQLVFLLTLFHFTVANFSSAKMPLCHGDERSALLQFKESFIINNSASHHPFAYPKVASWIPEGKSGECCSWDGIECDEDTGHVIGLNLTSSCLFGSINSSSSLFRLVHVEWLSLADNHFNHSEIPSGFGNLSRLSHLNLSFSAFSGEFPTRIFQLPNLHFLDVRTNPHLTGELPDSIGNLQSLNKLQISHCYFSGPIPSSLGNLNKLNYLDLSSNNFSGQIPSSFANLTQLTLLSLSSNSFSRGTLSWLGKLNKLTYLDLSDTNSYGDIPSSLGNLTQLTHLLLNHNQLTGQIPFWIGNLTQLRGLLLRENHLSGMLKFDLFYTLKSLFFLSLSGNNLSLLVNASINVTLPKFVKLGLNSCNLKEFPNFLRGQNELVVLELSNNKIKGQIPKWMLNTSKETLMGLDLNSNYLTGFEPFDRSPVFLPWTNLCLFDLSSNKLQGSFPIPPLSIFIYDVSNNRLTRGIPSMICNLTSPFSLDLSNNNFSGVLPSCLSNLSNTVSILGLRNNHFHGTIPQTYMKECKLRMIDFSQNQLQWQLPRSLANCTMLESLDLGNNQINDTFPSWLGILPQLKILILGSNRFYGAIGNPKTNFEFPKLQIIDLSNNSFGGTLPSEYFQTWTAMKSFDANVLAYMQANASLEIPGQSFSFWHDYGVTLTNKGMKREYEEIPEFLAAIDLSCNRFEGEIPEVIGNLKALYLLNLENNSLTGHIPSSLGNLTELESLDLSQNQLSGEIPQQLSQITFLAFLNVSYNRLTGLIPQGKQFNTFQNNSFDGNPGLCGNPLSKICRVSPPPPSSTAEEDKSSSSPFDFDWKVVLMGYACGLVVGVFGGYIVITRKHEWFAMTFGIRQQKMRRVKRRGHGN